MKTMNFKTMIVAAIAALLFFSACKKEQPAPPPPAPTIAGVWEGLYGTKVTPPAFYWNYQVNKDGTILLKTSANAAYDGKGTWTLTDNVFRAKYKYEGDNTVYFITAIVDVPTGVMAGKYSVDTEDAVAGDFKMNRK